MSHFKRTNYVDLEVNGRLFPSFLLHNFSKYRIPAETTTGEDPCKNVKDAKIEIRKYQEFISKYVSWTKSPFQIRESRISMKHKLETLKVSDRLKNVQKEMVNEKIALNMLSEIYLISPKDSCKLSVFTKDINDKILSYLQ